MWRKFNKPLLAKMRRASREYGLIQPYDKIAVGLSGGPRATLLQPNFLAMLLMAPRRILAHREQGLLSLRSS